MKKIIDQLEEYLIASLICGMVLFETINAIMHAMGAAQTGLPEEIAIYCYIWIAFLSASFCAKKGCDVAVTMLSDKYSEGLQKAVRVICSLINLAVSICLLIGSFLFVSQTAEAGSVGKLSGIPLVLVYSASVVGYLLCTFRNTQKVIGTFKKEKNA